MLSNCRLKFKNKQCKDDNAYLKGLQFCYIKTNNEQKSIQIYSLHKHSYSVKNGKPI